MTASSNRAIALGSSVVALPVLGVLVAYGGAGAALLVAIAVLFAGAYVLARSRSPVGHKYALVLVLVWVFAVGLNWTTGGYGDSSGLGTAIILRAAGYMGVLGVFVVMLLTPRSSTLISSMFGGARRYLTLWALWGVISVLWSVQPTWSAYRALEFLAAVAATAILGRYARSVADLKLGLNTLWILCGAMLATVAIGVIIVPSEAVRTGVGSLGIQVSGVLPALGSNGVGDYAAILLVVSLNRLLAGAARRRLYVSTAIAGGVFLLLSQSRTPVLAALLAVGYLMWAYRHWALMSMSLLGSLAAILSPWLRLLRSFAERGQSVAMILSLSGRTTFFWGPALRYVAERPLIGWGAYAGGRYVVAPLAGLDPASGAASSVDSVWLEVLLSTGLVGLVLVVMGLATTGRQLWHQARTATDPVVLMLSREALAVLLMIVVRGFFSTNNLIWVPFLPFLGIVWFSDTLAHLTREESS